MMELDSVSDASFSDSELHNKEVQISASLSSSEEDEVKRRSAKASNNSAGKNIVSSICLFPNIAQAKRRMDPKWSYQAVL